MNLPFLKYESIPGIFKSKQIRKMEYEFPTIHTLEFVVLEKAHGAHFSIQTDGVKIESGSRNRILHDMDRFFNHPQIVEKYRFQSLEIFALVSNLYHTKSIQIDGELIGGTYPHPEVKPTECSRIQKGVFYCPDHQFFVYDIKYYDSNNWTFIDYDTCIHLFEKVGLVYAKPLARGTFKEVINFNPSFQTCIPEQLNLPSINNNCAEGVVIKPMVPLFYLDGKRLIFKKKHSKFKEVFKCKKINLSKDIPPEIDKDIAVKMCQMVNENRLDNVISKIGEVTKKDVRRLISLLCGDVITTYNQEEDNRFSHLEGYIKKYLVKRIQSECSQVVNKYFANDTKTE